MGAGAGLVLPVEPEWPGERFAKMRSAASRTMPNPSLHHLEQLMESLLEGVILMDPTGVILGANAAALTMHGIERVEDLGETADDYAQRFCLRYRDHRRLA